MEKVTVSNQLTMLERQPIHDKIYTYSTILSDGLANSIGATLKDAGGIR